MANARNKLPIIIPCHRVIGKNGSLTGFGGGIETKRYLLGLENLSSNLKYKAGTLIHTSLINLQNNSI